MNKKSLTLICLIISFQGRDYLFSIESRSKRDDVRGTFKTMRGAWVKTMLVMAILEVLVTMETVSSSSNWIQTGNDIDGEAQSDESGSSVSISSDGTIVAIGAPKNADAGHYAGQVRVYQWNGASWTQMGNDIDGESVGAKFGHSVSLSSDGMILATYDSEFTLTSHTQS